MQNMTRHVHRPRLLWLFAAFAACCSVWRSPGQAFVSASGAWGMRHAPCGPLVSAIRLYAGPTAEAARVELRDETRLLRETVTDLVSEAMCSDMFWGSYFFVFGEPRMA